MADDDLLADLASEAADLSTVPSDSGVARLRKLGMELVETERRVDELDRELKAAKIRRWELQTRELPDLMSELMTDHLGLPEAGVDLVSGDYTHANISAEWEEERRDAGFAHLEEVGGGDIIKNTVTFVFGRGQHDEVQEFLEKIRALNLSFDPPECTISRMVPWNTLTAFVREQIGRGTVLDLEKLGATVGSMVKIKQRTK